MKIVVNDKAKLKDSERELKELLGKIVDGLVDKDIKEGEALLKKCAMYDINSKQENLNLCLFYNHKREVLNYIKKIISNYRSLINLANMINGLSSCTSSNENKSIECSELINYVDFLKRVKEAKKCVDNIEKAIKAMKVEDKNE